MKHYGIEDTSDEHECRFGNWERSYLSGTLHRKCTEPGCKVISLDGDNDDA